MLDVTGQGSRGFFRPRPAHAADKLVVGVIYVGPPIGAADIRVIGPAMAGHHPATLG